MSKEDIAEEFGIDEEDIEVIEDADELDDDDEKSIADKIDEAARKDILED